MLRLGSYRTCVSIVPPRSNCRFFGQGKIFYLTEFVFEKSQSDEIAIENCYAQMRKKLRELNLGAPSESSMRLVSNFAKVEELILLDELWEEFDANSQS